MRSTERKLKNLAKRLPKSKTALLFPDEEEKARLPLFSKVAIPLMAVLICFCLTLAVSAEVREAVFGLFKNNPVSSVSSEAPVSSDYEKRGPKAFYTGEELADVTPTETKEDVDKFAELLEEFFLYNANDPNAFNKEAFKESAINVTPQNIKDKSAMQIFRHGRQHPSSGSIYYIVYDGKIFMQKNVFLTSALVCDSNDDGNEEIVIAFFYNTYGMYPNTRLFIFDTATKLLHPSDWVYDISSSCYSTLTYASEDDALEGIFFYVLKAPMKYTEDYHVVLDHSENYILLGDIRLDNEGKFYYHEYTEEELTEINSQG